MKKKLLDLFEFVSIICALVIIGIVTIDMYSNVTENGSIWDVSIKWLIIDIVLLILSFYVLFHRNIFKKYVPLQPWKEYPQNS